MYLYVFIRTLPGMAAQVMECVVDQGAARAVAVTGPYDVIAKYTNTTWDQLAEQSLSPAQCAGVVSTSTATVVNPLPAPEVSIITWPPTMPFSKPSWGPRCALTLMKTRPGGLAQALGSLQRHKAVKAVVPLFGEHDLMAQICGRDENHIGAQLTSALDGLDQITSTMTCLIVRAYPEKGDASGGGYRRPKSRGR